MVQRIPCKRDLINIAKAEKPICSKKHNRDIGSAMTRTPAISDYAYKIRHYTHSETDHDPFSNKRRVRVAILIIVRLATSKWTEELKNPISKPKRIKIYFWHHLFS